MSTKQRDAYGKYVSPTNEFRDEVRGEHGYDVVYVEAQHVHVGMMALHPGAKPSSSMGWKRVVRVQQIYKGICLHFEDETQMQRDLDHVILINASDLPTAFALSRYEVPYSPIGHDSLSRMREKLDGR